MRIYDEPSPHRSLRTITFCTCWNAQGTHHRIMMGTSTHHSLHHTLLSQHTLRTAWKEYRMLWMEYNRGNSFSTSAASSLPQHAATPN